MKTLEQIKFEIELVAERRKQTAENDYNNGVRDCRIGIYDKFYRYNHEDEGAAYDAGWMAQNQITKNESVKFIGI